MRILALDLAEYRVGWALGDAGSRPEVGVFKLRRKGERIEEAIPRLSHWLCGNMGLPDDPYPPRSPKPMLEGADLVVMEAYVPIGAPLFTSPASQEGQILLAGAVRMACGLWRIPVRAPSVSTVRVHFCGKASAAPRRPKGHRRTAQEQQRDRAASKMMVVKRAQLLGYIPKDCEDTDLADSCALFDFASSHWGRAAASFELTNA